MKLGPQIPLRLNKKMKKIHFLPIPFLVLVFVLGSIYILASQNTPRPQFDNPSEIARKYNPFDATKIPASPTPTPTSRPLTFAEMNALYGPCANLPTLFYHHIQDLGLAKTKNQQNLTVDTEIFKKQMQYLKDKGYQALSMSDLVSFFDSGASLPKKSLLLTFDDGYDDFYLNAYPILNQLGFKATMFTPTGLIGNPGYLSWDQIASMSNVEFANHTWSHKSMRADGGIDEKEIVTADTQLTERGLDSPKVFAYPYGTVADIAESILTKYGYKAAFTTRHGSILCKKQRLILPRIRIGNINLSGYGF